MSEFLPGPSWRERARPDTRWIAVVATFAIIATIGLGVLYAGVRALDWIGAGSWGTFLLWVIPACCVSVWVLRAPQPATASDREAQPWTEYALRSIMVGVDHPRWIGWRILTAFVFGPPLVGFGVIYLALSFAGIA